MPVKQSRVHRLSIPNPYFEGANSVYLIDGEPPTLIDTGIGTEQAYAALADGLKQHGLSVEAVGQVVLTHKHVDHAGLARRIHEQSSCRVFVHELDWEGVTHLEERAREFVSHVHELLTSWGVPVEDADTLAGFMEQRGWQLQSCPAERLTDGQRIPVEAGEIEVIHTPGHTVGSICLVYDEYLFTGDHVLSVLSPNIGGGELGEPNLLGQYLNSLDRVRALHGETLSVMPGHGQPWNGLDQVCGRLAQHHADRLKSLEQIIAEGKESTIFEMAEALFGSLSGIHLWLGTAEVYSHLEYLVEQGRLVEKDGCYRPA